MVEAPDQVPRTIAAVPRTPTSYPWEAVLEPGRDEELVATSREREQAGLTEPIPDDLHPALREGLEAAGIDALWAHQADALEAARRGHAIVTTGTASGKSLAFNLPVLDTLASDVAARAFYLYPTKALAQDQARGLARLAQGAGGARGAAMGPGALPPPRDLRRRHAARGAALDQAAVEPDPHEPGHAPRGRAAEPPPVGRRARQPRLGRGGRGARVPRRVRLARGERAAAPAAAGARLRRRAALPAHERDDREPDRAGRAPDRRGGRARGPRRRAARGAPDRHVEPAARGREARPARLRPRRGRQPAGVARASARSARSAS